MKTSVKQMQGTSAFIETHYEAMAYWRQEKKICYYLKNGVCENVESMQHKKACIGYTKCSNFISDERYHQKKAKEYKRTIRRKNKENVKSRKQNSKLPENAIGNDPRLKDIFDMFR